MSPETLLEPTLVDPTPNLNPNQPFDPDSFNSYVMNTYGRFPIAIAKGLGCLLWDTSGKQYLDFVAGIATCTLGHAHPALIEVVSQQIQKLHHVSNLYYIPEQGELAKWIVDHSCADKVFFCNSGAEANEAAIKLVRKYAHTVLDFLEQPVILTAHASFHGRTLATITATGQPKYQKDFEPLMPGFAYIPYNDIEAVENAIADLDEGNRRVAAIMLEPLQGEGGVRPGDIEYFQRLRQICDENNILLVFDEVQVGVGRTGKLWGYENLGVEPDIFTSAKGLAGGIPIGAMMCRKFCDVFDGKKKLSNEKKRRKNCFSNWQVHKFSEKFQLCGGCSTWSVYVSVLSETCLLHHGLPIYYSLRILNFAIFLFSNVSGI